MTGSPGGRGPAGPRRLKAGPGPSVLILVLVLGLVGLLCGRKGEGAGTPDPLAPFAGLAPDSLAARLAEAPAEHAARFDSLLATGALTDPARRPILDAVAAAYLDATGDSLLLGDLAFCEGRPESTRTAWAAAVAADRRGVLLRGNGDYAGSAEALREAALGYRAVGHLRREAVAWGTLGVSLWYTGDFNAVIDAYRNALDARERLGDPVLVGRTLNGLGSANLQLGNYVEALRWYERARAVRETLGNANDLATTLAYIGNVRYRLGDLIGAREGYAEALRVLGPNASSKSLSTAQVGLANVMYDLGEYEEALALYREVVERAEAAGDRRLVGLTRQNLARTLTAMGDYAGALATFDRAREEQEALGDQRQLAVTLNSLGSTYRLLGDVPRALEELKRAEKTAAGAGDELTRANVLLNLGLAYSDWKLPERGLEACEQALALHETLADTVGMRGALVGVGINQWMLKDYEGALERFRRALELDRARGLDSNAAGDRIQIGNTLTDMGEFGKALDAYREAAAAGEELGSRDLLWPAYLGMADVHEKTGDLARAADSNDRAIDALESVRGHALSEETKSEALSRRAYVYEAQEHVLAKLYAGTGDLDTVRRAFAVAERGKARALLDLLAEGRIDPDAGLDSASVGERRRRERELTAARYRLRLATGSGVDADSLKTLKREVGDRESAYQELLERLRLQNPSFAAADPGRPKSLSEIRRDLLKDDRGVLLEYALGDSASYLWVVTRSGLAFHALPPRAEVEGEVQKLRAGLVDPGTAGDAAYLDAAHRLYAMLLGPAATELADARAVVVVPDGALNFIPFDVLLTSAAVPPDPDLDAGARNRVLRRAPLRASRGPRPLRPLGHHPRGAGRGGDGAGEGSAPAHGSPGGGGPGVRPARGLGGGGLDRQCGPSRGGARAPPLHPRRGEGDRSRVSPRAAPRSCSGTRRARAPWPTGLSRPLPNPPLRHPRPHRRAPARAVEPRPGLSPRSRRGRLPPRRRDLSPAPSRRPGGALRLRDRPGEDATRRRGDGASPRVLLRRGAGGAGESVERVRPLHRPAHVRLLSTAGGRGALGGRGPGRSQGEPQDRRPLRPPVLLGSVRDDGGRKRVPVSPMVNLEPSLTQSSSYCNLFATRSRDATYGGTMASSAAASEPRVLPADFPRPAEGIRSDSPCSS